MAKTIKIAWVETKLLPYTKLKPFQGNLKTLSDENYQKLKKEILELDFSEPVSAWLNSGRKYYLLNGHQRIKAITRMVEEEDFECPDIPVNVIKAKDFKEAKKKVLALTSQYGTMTEAGLKGFMSDAGLTFGEVKASFNFPEVNFGKLEKSFGASSAGDDDVPEAPKKPRSKLGDLYVLGRHRLLCGDATVSERVEFLLDGKRADMVFTDPPYGINLDTNRANMKGTWTRNTRDYAPVKGDDKEFDPAHILKSFEDAKEIFLWGGDYYCWHLPRGGSWIVWDKANQNEQLDKMWGSAFELCWSREKHKRDLARVTWRGVLGHSQKDDGALKVHPTQKPVKLAEWFFEKYGDGLKTVVDLYGGSGPFLIACEKTKRQCFMMELEPLYIDVIVSRWCKFTGQTEVVKNGKKVKWLSD